MSAKMHGVTQSCSAVFLVTKDSYREVVVNAHILEEFGIVAIV